LVVGLLTFGVKQFTWVTAEMVENLEGVDKIFAQIPGVEVNAFLAKL
jgi:hypothetical protein